MKKWTFPLLVVLLALSAVTCGCTKTQYSITIATNGDGGTTAPSAGTYKYEDGQSATITATPATSWKFDSWSGDASGSDATITILMDGDKSVTANFALNYVPQSHNLVDGVITVYAGDYYDVPFSVDIDTMHDVTVSGSFAASGGSGNDVEVYVMNASDYANWVNGHSSSALYSSGRITAADLNIPITASGNYHLVYSNTFSWISTKTVNTSVDLEWSELA